MSTMLRAAIVRNTVGRDGKTPCARVGIAQRGVDSTTLHETVSPIRSVKPTQPFYGNSMLSSGD
jgi:hypothetical protein